MKNCEAFAELLDPFVDGELSAEDCAAVREHLNLCPECRDYVADALAIRAAFPDAEDTRVPADFAQSVLDQLPARATKTARPWKRTILPLAACFAVVVGVGVLSVQNRQAAASDQTALPIAQNYSTVSTPEPAQDKSSALPHQAREAMGDTAEAEESAPVEEESLPESQAPASAPPAIAPASLLPEDSGTPEPPTPFAVEGRVLSPEVTFGPEASALFSAYTPTGETETERLYTLTAQEYAELEATLLQQEITPISATGDLENAESILVHVLI